MLTTWLNWNEDKDMETRANLIFSKGYFKIDNRFRLLLSFKSFQWRTSSNYYWDILKKAGFHLYPNWKLYF